MALSNTAPGLIKIPGQQHEFGKVLKSSVRMCAPNVVSMRIATGMGKKIKKVPERLTKEIKIPIENLWLGPVDTEVGLAKPESISVVLTNVDEILPDLWKKFKEMEASRETVLTQNLNLKKNLKDLVKRIQQTQSENPILIAHAEGIAQSMQG